MTDWKKTYSVWFNIAIGLASASLATALYLQTQKVPWAPMAVLVVNAVTVFLRSLPQSAPAPKPRVRVEERGWVPFYLLPWIALFAFVSLLLIACAPRLTETEVRCLANVEVRESLELAACGKDTSGPCSTDAVMDKYDPQAEACVAGGAK